MLRILIAGGILAFAAPLAAQQTSAPAPAEPAPAPGAPPAQTTDQSPVAEAATGAANSEFASYDTDKSGQLDKSEFSAWFAAKHAGHDGAEAKSSAKDVTVAFKKADVDKSKSVSEQELGQFLAG